MSASAPTLSLHLAESQRLRVAGTALHAAAIAAVVGLPGSLAGSALLAAVLLPICAWAWLLRRRPSPRHLEITGDGRCTVVDRRGAVLEGALGGGSLALPGVVVLEVDRPGRRRFLWLASDAFPDDELRRLRVRLRVAA